MDGSVWARGNWPGVNGTAGLRDIKNEHEGEGRGHVCFQERSSLRKAYLSDFTNLWFQLLHFER